MFKVDEEEEAKLAARPLESGAMCAESYARVRQWRAPAAYRHPGPAAFIMGAARASSGHLLGWTPPAECAL